MDLNQLYFDHQIALIRESYAPNRVVRANYRARATELASDIFGLHRAAGASAIAHWGLAGSDRLSSFETSRRASA